MSHPKKIFSDADAAAIAHAITEAEKTTAGEIRVGIRQRRTRGERKLTLEQMARKEFHELGMTKTQGKTGILIFLLLEDRQFYILADEGIHSKVDEGTWARIATEMSGHFSRKQFRDGVIFGVQSVGHVLSKHVPAGRKDPNELSNEVDIR